MDLALRGPAARSVARSPSEPRGRVGSGQVVVFPAGEQHTRSSQKEMPFALHFAREQASIGAGPRPARCPDGDPASTTLGAGPFPGFLVCTLLLGGPEYSKRG